MSSFIRRITLLLCVCAVAFTVLFLTLRLDVFLTLAITFCTIAYHFLMRLIVGLLYDRALHNHVSPDHRWFRVPAAETRLYDLLRVRRWKRFLPSYTPADFDPRLRSWQQIAGAMCQAELVHETILPLCFLPVLASIRFGHLPVFLITSVFSAVQEVPFIILQRYNRPRVLALAARLQARRRG